MSEDQEPRLVHPYQTFGENGIKNFGPEVVRVEEDEVVEPAPKDYSAQASVFSPESSTVQSASGTPVQHPTVTPVQENESDAALGSGKGKDETRDGLGLTESHDPETSSPDSSLATNPGWSEPPAPVAPPTNV